MRRPFMYIVRAREAVARYVHATGVGGRVRFRIALYSGFAQGYWICIEMLLGSARLGAHINLEYPG